MKNLLTLVLALGMAFTLHSCGSTHTLTKETKSDNPVVAAQAQKVLDLKKRVEDQENVVKAEEAKLSGLKRELSGAEENMKGVRMTNSAK